MEIILKEGDKPRELLPISKINNLKKGYKIALIDNKFKIWECTLLKLPYYHRNFGQCIDVSISRNRIYDEDDIEPGLVTLEIKGSLGFCILESSENVTKQTRYHNSGIDEQFLS